MYQYQAHALDSLLQACLTYLQENPTETYFMVGNVAGRDGVDPNVAQVKKMLDSIVEADTSLVRDRGPRYGWNPLLFPRSQRSVRHFRRRLHCLLPTSQVARIRGPTPSLVSYPHIDRRVCGLSPRLADSEEQRRGNSDCQFQDRYPAQRAIQGVGGVEVRTREDASYCYCARAGFGSPEIKGGSKAQRAEEVSRAVTPNRRMLSVCPTLDAQRSSNTLLG